MPLQRQVRPHRQVAGHRPVDLAGPFRLRVPKDRVTGEPVLGQRGDLQLVVEVHGDHPGADGMHPVVVGRADGQGEVELGRGLVLDRFRHL